MGVSMVTEQNGAGNQGAAWALWRGSPHCRSRVMAGKGRGCQGSERVCSPYRWDGRCPSPSAGAAPEPAPSTHAPGPWRVCDGQRCPMMPCRAMPCQGCQETCLPPSPRPPAVTAISAPPGPLALVPPPRSPVSGLSSRLLNLGFSVTPSGKNVSKNTQHRHSASRGGGLLPVPPQRVLPAPVPSASPGHRPTKPAPAQPWL